MPHSARKKSSSGYYHIVPKGIANQLIFQDEGDRQYYVQLLGEAKAEFELTLHAYVLMSNHTHLIIEDRSDKLALAMKYLHERYAMSFSEKIGRTGGVFRKPYWSEPIDTDDHLLCSVRYVHANPAAAGICQASAYEWSSAKDYLGRDGITDTAVVLDMLGGRRGFIDWSQAPHLTAHAFPGSQLRGHLTDEEAMILAKGIIGMQGLDSIASLPLPERRQKVSLLVEHGFGIALLSRLIGVSESQVRRLSR